MAGGRNWLLHRCLPTVSAALVAASVLVGIMPATPAEAATTAVPAAVTAAATTAIPAAVTAPAVTPVAGKADLSVAVAAPGVWPAGTQATFTITVKNTGPTPAQNVTVTDTLPLGFSLKASASTSFGACTATTPSPTVSSTVTCTLRELPVSSATVPPATIAVTVVIDSVAASSASIRTSVTSTTPDPNPANNTATTSKTVVSRADLTIGLAHPGGFAINQQGTYTITVKNNGPSSAGPGTIVTDDLPNGITLVSSAGSGWICWLGTTASQVVCPLTTPLDAGATTAVTLTVAVSPAAGSFGINRARVATAAPTIDPVAANNTASDPTAIPASLASGGSNDPGPCGPPIAPASGPPVRTCSLIAKLGSLPLPDTGPLPIWGFAIDNGSLATVPGVTLIATEGETVVLNVRNVLPAGADPNNLSLVLPGAATSAPDSVGKPSIQFPGTPLGAEVGTYTYTGLKPGTYVYEAGPTVNGARQVAMGLSGLLIVRPKGFTNTGPARTLFGDPAPGGTACSTGGASTTFTAETLLVMNEFNRAFNANPLNSSLSGYAPDVFLINGQAYPSTPQIPVGTGDCLMAHIADLGLAEHSVGFLNLRQTVVANDSQPLSHPQSLAANYLNPGQESDAAIWMVKAATPGALFPFLDFGRHLHNGAGQPASATNNTGMKLGGMLALVKVVGVPQPVTNPTTDSVSASPVTNDGTQAITVTATSTAHATGATCPPGAPTSKCQITAAEWSIDAIASAGSGTAVAPFPAPGSPLTYAITVPALPLQTLEDGDHIVWVRAQDSAGTWADPPVGAIFTLSKKGPSVYALSADPGLINGQGVLEGLTNGSTPNKQPFLLGDPNAPTNPTDLVVTGTAEPALADWTISAAEYCIDATTCNGTNPMNFGTTAGGVFGPPNPGGPAAIGAAIPARVMSALPRGTHTINVRATEAPPAGIPINPRPGPWTALAVIMVTDGPTARIASVTPDPAGTNANTSGNLNYLPAVRLSGTLAAAVPDATVSDGELFFGNITDPDPGSAGGQQYGKGVQLTPAGGLWGQANTLAVYGDIPVASFTAFPEGKVRIWIHGKDVAGNWGSVAHYDLTLDKTPPAILDSGSGVTGITDPRVTPGAGANTYTLDFWAQDRPGALPQGSTVVAVEWRISYAGVIDNPNTNLFTNYLASPANGPVELSFDISGGPQPYPAGALVVYRVRDGAGNWSDYRQTPIR